ncbi:MAG: ClpXP protease specificity-enhancing factor SspB [Azospirillaceae bacterium]
MADQRLRYDRMVERALRNVVRESLQHAAVNGLPGEHHFYMTFSTRHPGIDIPDFLRERYPEEMTIVLQYQYYGLEVNDDVFSVTLSFNNKHERLTVPLAAITTFADPSVNFALQFQAIPTQEGEDEAPAIPQGKPGNAPEETPAPAAADQPAAEDAPEDGGTEDGAKVVTLDSFRKNNK